MKSKLITIFLVLLFLSCSTTNEKDKLIGNWSSTGRGTVNEFQFFQDSLIVDEMGINYLNLWEITNKKIFVEILDGDGPEIYKEITFDYKLNSNKDTLSLKRETDSVFTRNLIKIHNGYDYMLKNIRIPIELPQREYDLTSSTNKRFEFNVYVGYKKGNLIVKTDKHNNLEDIKYRAIKQAGIYNSELDSMKYILLADKRVPKAKIDSIKKLLRNKYINKVFRVYTNNKTEYNKTDWHEPITWYGAFE